MADENENVGEVKGKRGRKPSNIPNRQKFLADIKAFSDGEAELPAYITLTPEVTGKNGTFVEKPQVFRTTQAFWRVDDENPHLAYATVLSLTGRKLTAERVTEVHGDAVIADIVG